MGIYGSVMTDTGESRSLQNGKPIISFHMGLANYCHSVEHGEALSEYDVWFQHLEIPNADSLCAISAIFRRSIWHIEAIFTEAEYERFVAIMSQNPDYTPNDYSYQAFLDMLASHRRAYAPVADYIADVRRLLERIKQVNPPDNSSFYEAEYTLDELEDLLAVLLEAQSDGVQKVCLMGG